MSGHSKWSTIKHKKGKADAKRGKVFTKIIREITTAAREGGGDPDGNPRLRSAILAAKGANMPQDNINKAIQRGTGELPGVSYEEVIYEGYGPGGVAVMLQVLTDNRNRTTAEVRHLFSKHGGNLGETGCVGYLFKKQGYLVVPKAAGTEDTGDGGRPRGRCRGLLCRGSRSLRDLHRTRPAAHGEGRAGGKGLSIEERVDGDDPIDPGGLEDKRADQMIRLMDAFEDHDDVQNVWSNADFDERLLEAS
jgi:transcriptional/translational regulatory protein YebC/TACO1